MKDEYKRGRYTAILFDMKYDPRVRKYIIAAVFEISPDPSIGITKKTTMRHGFWDLTYVKAITTSSQLLINQEAMEIRKFSSYEDWRDNMIQLFFKRKEDEPKPNLLEIMVLEWLLDTISVHMTGKVEDGELITKLIKESETDLELERIRQEMLEKRKREFSKQI